MASRARRYAVSRLAAADLRAIYAYGLERWGARQAERYQDDLFRAFDDLAAGRRMGRPLVDAYRKLSVGSHFVAFREDDAVIYVVRILHQRMDVGRHLKA